MRLLSGPFGSDATSLILAEFRQALARGAPNVRLLTPTATMAEHLRHELAREGFVFRPGLIQTLSKFIEPWTADLPQVSPATLQLIVERSARRLERSARRLARPEFERVTGAPGFYASLTHSVEEFSAAGCPTQRLSHSLPSAPFAPAFLAIYREVERELERRSLGLRAMRLERAARRIAQSGAAGLDTIWIDGFITFTDPELSVIRALGSHTDLTITLPDAIAPPALGCEIRRVESRRPPAVVEAFSAPTIDREAEEIARRILSAGCLFREIAIVVRNREAYLAPLRAALERFGVPARFYFSDPLIEHGTVCCLAAIVDALLSGWDWALTLAAVRLTESTPALDAFDFTVRKKLPGAGIEGLLSLARDARLEHLLSRFAALSSTSALPPAAWAERLSGLRDLLPVPQPADRIPAGAALLFRSQAAALKAFASALAEAAAFLGDARRIPLAEFWTAAQSILRLTPLDVPDRRRNVVHVLSAFEARQWELREVFVCGLTDREFPKLATPDLFFPDAAMAQLAASGVRVRTSTDREAEERMLFDLAATRPTGRLTLSYPEVDSRGVLNSPSPFLRHPVRREATLVRPPATAPPASPPAAPASVARSSFSATGLESFLDCPFQFFARHTLRLEARPFEPQDRLDFLLQGKIIHQALSDWHVNPQPIGPLFERIFSSICDEYAVFRGYKTENHRRQMLADLRRFGAWDKLPAAVETLTEYQFEMDLDGGVRLRGRIDRIDKQADGRALIVDYKYSAAAGVTARVRKESLLQGGLYALAARRILGLEPAGVLYFGLKKELKPAGWSDPPGVFGVKTQPLTEEWIEDAAARALTAAADIRAGRIEPDPADLEICRLCDYKDVCRFEAARALSAENSET